MRYGKLSKPRVSQLDSVVIFLIMDMYQLRPRLLRVRVLGVSRFQFQVIRVVYQAAED